MIISIANQKGGVAKTTTSGALAVGLKNRGYKVLSIDLDPQGNFSDSLGADNTEKSTIYELLKKEATVQETIQTLPICDFISANILLAGAEQEINETGKEHRLSETIESIKSDYDFIIIDTPPSLGILTVNAFTTSDKVIIPSTAGIFAAKGIKQLYRTIINVKKYCNKDLDIEGILITRYNPRTTINKDIKELTTQLAEQIQSKVYNTYIRNSVIIEEAQASRKDIYSYSNKSTVSIDYENFVQEFLEALNNGEKI